MEPTTRNVGAGRRLALVALALAASLLIPGTAGAASTNFNAMVYSQYGNGFCGEDMPELPHLAFVKLVKKGPWLKVEISMDGTPALADHVYNVYIYDGATCEEVGYLGTFTTNLYAVGSVTYPRWKLPAGTTSVFIAIHDGTGWNDTPVVP